MNDLWLTWSNLLNSVSEINTYEYFLNRKYFHHQKIKYKVRGDEKILVIKELRWP